MTVTGSYTRAHRAFKQAAEDAGLLGVDARVLAAILEAPDPATIPVVSRAITGQDDAPPYIRKAITRLEDAGLLERHAGEIPHRRSPGWAPTRLTLTFAGAELAREIVTRAGGDVLAIERRRQRNEELLATVHRLEREVAGLKRSVKHATREHTE